METKPPIELVSYSRFMNKKFLEGKKADICICGKTNYGWSKETKCGEVCYYTKENLDLKIKNKKAKLAIKFQSQQKSGIRTLSNKKQLWYKNEIKKS